MKDSNFYNKESTQYSDKRYPQQARTYTQFFFKRRLALTLGFIVQILPKTNQPSSLLEVGCADGVVIRAVEDQFPAAFEKIVGIDIAQDMIEEAKKKNIHTHVQFYTRASYTNPATVDVVIETGVANYAQVDEELLFAHQNLRSGGFYILSLAGTGSLLNRLKPEKGFNDFRSYREYEALIREQFVINQVRGCGFFVPYLWRVPAMARVVQPVLETLAGRLAPGLCHEKVYLLQKK